MTPRVSPPITTFMLERAFIHILKPLQKLSSAYNSQHFRRHLKRFLFMVQPTFYFGAKISQNVKNKNKREFCNIIFSEKNCQFFLKKLKIIHHIWSLNPDFSFVAFF